MSGAPMPRTRVLPGKLGLWIFIFSDLLLFGLYFGLYAVDFGNEPALFQQSQAALNRTIGLINTLVLLLGSWAVMMGTRVVTEPVRAGGYLAGAAFSGLVFLAFKIFEYTHLLGLGHSIGENRFFTWYFFLTAYHALHVMAGVMLLWTVSRRLRRDEQPGPAWTEGVGCYWHLVDLLWIGIFSLLYLL
jgi:nitric oxide reductase NorE protein